MIAPPSYIADKGNPTKWKMGEPGKDYIKYFKKHHTHKRYIPEFETDVTNNPYWHSNPDKIREIKRKDLYPPNSYRWAKSDLRIVYYPQRGNHTIYPLTADTAQQIRYKKR